MEAEMDYLRDKDSYLNRFITVDMPRKVAKA
jgi:hypothetical protein